MVSIDVFESLCELYPKTAAALRELCVLKREIYLHYMEASLRLEQPAQIQESYLAPAASSD